MKKSLFVFVIGTLTALISGCHGQTSGLNVQSPAPLFTPASGSRFAVGDHPLSMAVGDWNNDGKLDIVVGNAGNKLAILLGNGRGNFTPAPGSPLEAAAHLIVVGDVNNDRHLDLVVAEHDSFGVVVLLGKADGAFATAAGSPFAAFQGAKPHNHGLDIGDVNSDGNLDLTTSNYENNSASILLGDGKGNFRPAAGSPFPVGRGPYNHSLGDMNLDGHLDIVTPNVRDNNVTVLLGDGRGGLIAAAGSPYPVEYRPYYTAIGDLNGDRKPDLVTTHDDINKITVSFGNGRGGFTAALRLTLDIGLRGNKVIIADVNRDAKMDVVIGNAASNHLMVLLGDNRGNLKPAPGSPYATGKGSPTFALGDFNGDGKPDIATAGSDGSDGMLFLGIQP